MSEASEMSTTHRQASLDDPVAQDLLTSTVPARLAYTWTDGTPRVVPLWFHWTGQDIVMATLPRAPKLRALSDGSPVALTIDSDAFPYRVLSIRGTTSLTEADGIVPEYRAAAVRYLGADQGQAWLNQLPAGLNMWRIAVRPVDVRILDFETRFPSALTPAAQPDQPIARLDHRSKGQP